MVSYRFAQAYGRTMARLRAQEEQEAYEKTPQGQREKALRQQKEREEAERAAFTKERLSKPIPLGSADEANTITFGTHVPEGNDLSINVRKIPHMLVVGTSGSGKSVFLHQLVYQLVHRATEVEKVIIIDLKGGIEFDRYRDQERVKIVWQFSEVRQMISFLIADMERRQDVMRAQGVQNWTGPRTFLIIDEYAEIHDEVSDARSRDEKEQGRQLVAQLRSIARRARALGIVLVCALQKATTDAMDSSLRANLSLRICFRVASKLFATSVLDDLSSLPVDPIRMRTGRFVFYDTSKGKVHYMQAHVAPGLTLSQS